MNVSNISFRLGRRAIAGAGCYVSSKWGLEGLTQVTAREGEDRGVLANALDPGGRAKTDIWAHFLDEECETILEPYVIVDAAILLAAQEPNGVTGESLHAEWEIHLR